MLPTLISGRPSGNTSWLDHVIDLHDLHASTVATGLRTLTAHVVVRDECFTTGHAAQVVRGSRRGKRSRVAGSGKELPYLGSLSRDLVLVLVVRDAVEFWCVEELAAVT